MKENVLMAIAVIGLMLGTIFAGCIGESEKKNTVATDATETSAGPSGSETEQAPNQTNATENANKTAENIIFSDDFDDSAVNSAWKTADCDAEDGTSFEEKDGMMQIYAGGVDVYDATADYMGYFPVPIPVPISGTSGTPAGAYAVFPPMADQYGAVYTPISGNFEVSVKVVSVDTAGTYAKGGIMVKNDISAAASSKGHLILGAENAKGRGTYFGWDADDNGYIEKSATVASALPIWLKLAKNGTKFTASQSTDGIKWSELGSVDIASAEGSQSVGLFYCANSYADNTLFWQPNHQMGWAKFDNFTIQKA
ncbi:MAG: hypothetical protein PHH26_02145 [Candidatus Thermoplasmatota archaeon]|nr:hypothetical protein [Candidatus Thermoplasmatota archaeon]